MKILICSLIFIFTIFFNSVQSVKQPPRPNQPPPRNLLKYNGILRLWLFRGEIYGTPCGGSIHRWPGGLECQRTPYLRQRRRQIKRGITEPTPFLTEVKIMPPDLQEGDILYRGGKPFGRVGPQKTILELHPSHAGEPTIFEPQDGDTLVLSGQWIPNQHPEHIPDNWCTSCGSLL